MDSAESQLRDLELEGSIQSQSQCLLATNIGKLRAAEDFYRHSLEDDPGNLNLMIDYGKLVYKQCRYGECCNYFNNILSLGQTGALGISPSDSQARVLRIVAKAAAVYSKGSLRSALKEAREAQTWLREKPMECFGDLEIVLVEYSLRIIKNIQKRSNWLHDVDKTFPSANSDGMEWLGYDTWQRFLQDRGKHWEALTILNLTKSDLPPVLIVTGLESMVKDSDQQDSPTFIDLAATIALARFYAECSKFTAAREQHQKAKNLSRRLMESGQSITGTSLSLELEVAFLESHPSQDIAARSKEYAGLIPKAYNIHNFGIAGALFTIASDLAFRTFTWTGFSKWRKVNEELLAEATHDLSTLLIGRSRQWRYGGGRDLARLIEWFDNFDDTIAMATAIDDVFDDPLALHVKESVKRTIFGRLGDQHSLRRRDESERFLKKIETELPWSAITSNVEPHLREWVLLDERDTHAPLKVLINRVGSSVSSGDTNPTLAAQLLALPVYSTQTVEQLDPKALHDSLFLKPGNSQWPERLSSIKAWLAQDLSAVETGAGSYLLVRLQQLRVGTATEANEVEKENLVFQDLIANCNKNVRDMFRRNDLHCRSTIALCKLHNVAMKNKAARAAEYDELIDIYRDSLKCYEDPSLSRQLSEIGLLHVRIADACQRKRRLFNTPTIEDIEEHLGRAEAAFDDLRQDLAALKGSSSILGKTGFVSSIHGVTQLRDVAYRVYRRELLVNPNDKASQVKLWNWVQKSKGRALSDSMGFSTRLPVEMLHIIKRGVHAGKLAEWDAITEELKEALQSAPSPENANAVFYLRMRREELKYEMLSIDILADVVNLAEGSAIQFNEVGSLIAMAQKMDTGQHDKVALVDWFYVTDILGNRQLYCFIVRDNYGQEPEIKLLFLGSPEPAIQNWINKHLVKVDPKSAPGQTKLVPKMPSSPEAFEDLQGLRGLILPLQAITKPGEILILCPTESLHRLPLHAIQAGATEDAKEVFLARNPILYCHSISIFRLCVFSRLQNRLSVPSEHPTSPGFFPLNSKFAGRMDDEDLASLRKKALAALRTPLIEDDAVIQESFYKTIEDANCLYFLGHVHDAGSQPLDSHLVLYEDEEQEGCQHSESNIVRASGILDKAHLSPGAHVILISCASGVSYSASTDEFLGLVPAFLYSGARSTISTLWPINQLNGVQFSQSYFSQWVKDRRGTGIANFARCMRTAVLDLVKEYGEEDLSYWASFVFHGY